jgi:hypothetical protein
MAPRTCPTCAAMRPGHPAGGRDSRVGQDAIHPFLRAWALVGLALGALMVGDCARATELYAEALAGSRQVEERRGMYYALYGLAEVARVQHDRKRAVELMEEAHLLTLQQGDRHPRAPHSQQVGAAVAHAGCSVGYGARPCARLAIRNQYGCPTRLCSRGSLAGMAAE